MELINTVLLSITSYWIAIFKLPVAVYEEIESICRNFLWGYQPGTKGLNPIAWTTLCLAKQCGGAGLRDPKLWGQALLCKQIWDLQQKKDNLWIKWVQEYYMKRSIAPFHAYKPKSHDSCNWKHLMALKDKVLHFLPQCLSTAGIFQVSKAYGFLQGQLSTQAFHKTIWSNRILPKQQFFLWRYFLGRLSTLDRLHSFGLHLNKTVCSLCSTHLEDALHVFINCTYSKMVLQQLHLPLLQDHRNLKRLLFLWQGRKHNAKFSLLVTTLYHIWQERNNRIFKNKSSSSESLSATIAYEHSLWF